MGNTKDIIRKAFQQKQQTGVNRYMSAKKHEKYENLKGLEDLVDTDRYYSSKKREPIPYERQRELGISRPRQPEGPAVSIDEAYEKMRKNRRR